MKKQNGENKNYVLDSTAFLALFEDEPGAETVQELLKRAKKGEIIIFTSFVSLFYDAILLHKDPEFEQLKEKLEMLQLPYKKSGKG